MGSTHCFHHEDRIIGVLPDAHTHFQYRSYKAMVPSCPVPDCVVPPTCHLFLHLPILPLPSPDISPPCSQGLLSQAGSGSGSSSRHGTCGPGLASDNPLAMSGFTAEERATALMREVGAHQALAGWGSDVQQVLGSHLGHTWVTPGFTPGSHLVDTWTTHFVPSRVCGA